MNTMIQLRVKTAEGALIRVLGVVRRRGFEVARLVANRSDRDACVDVVMMVEGERPADVLVRQLEKLFDVEEGHMADFVGVPLSQAETVAEGALVAPGAKANHIGPIIPEWPAPTLPLFPATDRDAATGHA